MAAAAAAWRASAAASRGGGVQRAAVVGGPSWTRPLMRAASSPASPPRPSHTGRRGMATFTRPLAATSSPVAEDAAYGADQIQVKR
jgi:hypothetical protein